MARRRRRRARRRNQWVLTIIAFGIAFFFHDVWLDPLLETSPKNADQQTNAPPPLTTSRPENNSLDGGPHADVPERGTDPLEPSSFTGSKEQVQHAASLMASARNALQSGDKVLARAHYSEALESGPSSAQEIEARAELRKLGLETILSSNVITADPFSAYYTIAAGDTLLKIAKKHHITAALLARINNIENAHLIQAGPPSSSRTAKRVV